MDARCGENGSPADSASLREARQGLPPRLVSTPDRTPDRFVLEAGLTRANTTLAEAARRLATRERIDFTGLPGSALALLLTEGARKGAPPMLVITADQDSAFALA